RFDKLGTEKRICSAIRAASSWRMPPSLPRRSSCALVTRKHAGKINDVVAARCASLVGRAPRTLLVVVWLASVPRPFVADPAPIAPRLPKLAAYNPVEDLWLDPIQDPPDAEFPLTL